MEEIKWPAIEFSRGTMQVIPDQKRAMICSTLSFCRGWFNNLKIIDSVGNVFIIKEVTTIPRVTMLHRIFVQIINRRLTVEFTDYQLESQISLDEFKKIVTETIDSMEAENNRWSEKENVGVLKREVMSASSFRKVMQILTSPQSIPDEPENSSDGKDNM
ncbi:MAG: hypothetical protein BWY31_03379 [Lentisphaerae bacterium ADurb.Bin242]|nr:MAG: hypothetical protein BWY31_03379 [Lentisphaerae bacterium ADurb.Bin242]